MENSTTLSRQFRALFKALVRLTAVILFYTCIYGGTIYSFFGFLSLIGITPLSMHRSLVCGFIILVSQNIFMIIKKKG